MKLKLSFQSSLSVSVKIVANFFISVLLSSCIHAVAGVAEAAHCFFLSAGEKSLVEVPSLFEVVSYLVDSKSDEEEKEGDVDDDAVIHLRFLHCWEVKRDVK